jgi:hydrogenase maturation protein HypF
VDGPSVIAAGAYLKATLCIARAREAFVSQHLGDLRSAGTIRFHEQADRYLQSMLGVSPVLIACDLHPDHRSTLFARARGLPVLQVQHTPRRSPRSPRSVACTGVCRVSHSMLTDSAMKAAPGGGESMMPDGATWRRVGHLAPLSMPGGDLAAREPWRMGAAALWVLGRGQEVAERFPDIALAGRLAAVPEAIRWSSSTTRMGRLFDTAAALLDVRLCQSYVGQAAMEPDALVRVPRRLPGGYRHSNCLLDLGPLLAALLEPGLNACEGAELFHGTLIAGLSDWIGRAAIELGQTDVALVGGGPMNRVLAEGPTAELRARQLRPWLPCAVPANDGGLSLGQAAFARAWLKAGPGDALASGN